MQDTSTFVRQPNSRFCFVCGLESKVGLKLRFSDNGVDKVQAHYSVPHQYQSYPGVTHGGVVAAMLDEVGGRVIMAGKPTRFMMTAKMEVRYRKPVPVETPLILNGKLVRERGRQAQTHSEIRLPDGTVAAEAELTLVEIPQDYVVSLDLEELGWRVYPDNGSE